MTEPVLVVLLSEKCIHCIRLLQQWPDITMALLRIYPNLRIIQPITIQNGVIDTALYNADLLRFYALWTPITLLIPGDVWDKKLTFDNIQIMNGDKVNGEYHLNVKWDTRKPENFGLWLQDALVKLKQSPSEVKMIEKVDDNYSHKSSTTVCQHLFNLISIG
ncbi:MAG TPA: hypothetical protein VLG50_05785 [Candidatus Saccharimonadales bacterium]|nr:hypothetical protein [Candidatus Saccharimonadales bacterium]